MKQPTTPDLVLIKRTARNLKRQGHGTYMQALDVAARQLYGVRHFHEARANALRAAGNVSLAAATAITVSPVDHYLQTLQEYYLDF